jgi:uncharacterized membrane protein YidH (DUF202 family)
MGRRNRNDACGVSCIVTETIAAVLFYVGLGLLVYGTIRVTRASIEHGRRDAAGIAMLAASIIVYAGCVVAFLHSSRRVIPF